MIPSLVLHDALHMFPIAPSRFKTFRPYLYKILLYFNCHFDFYLNIIIYIEANSTNSYCTQQLQSCQRGIYIFTAIDSMFELCLYNIFLSLLPFLKSYWS